jgi:hypothetical protein
MTFVKAGSLLEPLNVKSQVAATDRDRLPEELEDESLVN